LLVSRAVITSIIAAAARRRLDRGLLEIASGIASIAQAVCEQICALPP